ELSPSPTMLHPLCGNGM
ncbi:hypothetical protein ADUPG1_014700, partial [Aduncisulcus paluster]